MKIRYFHVNSTIKAILLLLVRRIILAKFGETQNHPNLKNDRLVLIKLYHFYSQLHPFFSQQFDFYISNFTLGSFLTALTFF